MKTVTVEQIAITGYEVNRAFCAGLGDLSISPWDNAGDDIQESARSGVRFVLMRLRAGEIVTVESLHESWVNQKRADGWVFGPVKDGDAKTHPCLVPYDDLPIEQQVRDTLFLAVVHGMAHLLEGVEPA